MAGEPVKELSDEDVFGTQAPAAAASGEMSDEEVFGRGMLGWVRDLGKDIIQRGLKEGTAGLFKGVAEALPPDEGNAFRTAAGKYILQGVPYEEAKTRAAADIASGAAVPQHPTETLTYKIGGAIEDTGKAALTPQQPTGMAGDIAAGVGSLGTTIGPLAIVKAAQAPAAIQAGVRNLTMAGLPFMGSGEAAERARKAGATDAQVTEAARYGTVAGATDLADIALLRAGVRSGGAVRRALAKVIEGGLIEGTQEAVQQVIQNSIAKYGPGWIEGIVSRGEKEGTGYKPNQALMEEVLYNGFIGAIVGGGAKPILERGSGEARAVSPEQSVEAAAGYGGTAPIPPPPSAAPPGSTTTIDVNGVQRTTTVPTGPPPDVPPPTSPDQYGAVPPGVEPTSVPAMPPESGRLRPALGFEIKNEAGFWNVYIDGQLENSFGSDTDAVKFVNNHPIAKARLAAVTPPVQSGPKVPGEGSMDPRVVDFINQNTPGLVLPPDSKFTPPAGQMTDEDVFSARAQDLGDVKTNPGFSMRTASLLGANLYGGPEKLSRVTVKEIVQNGFDAIKGMIDQGKEKSGKIEVEIDPRTRTITVADDGSGIPLNVLAGPFLQVGGTQKTTKRASGGHGIAKMAFIFGNEDLHVATMHDGVVYSMETRGSDLFDFLEKGDEAKRPVIKRRTPNRQDNKVFPKGHGTLVNVKLPATYVDPSSGMEKAIPIDHYDFDHPVLTNSPLFEDIEVTLNGKELPIGRSFPLENFNPMMNINFAWGTARIYASKAETSAYRNAHILSNGLWQFDAQIKKVGTGYDSIPRIFYIDVQPKVDSGQPGYPFSLDRQSFSPRVQDDFAEIFKYVAMLHALETFAGNVTNYGDMQYLEVGSDGRVKVGPRTKVELKAPLPTTPFTNIGVTGGQISVKDGVLYVGGKKIPEITPDMMKDFAIDPTQLKVDQSEIDASKVVLHDNTEVVISDLERRTLSDMAREQFGEAFDEYVVGVGNLFIEMRNQASRLMHKQFPGEGYDGMKTDAIGISFDPEYRGVSIKIPFQGEFLNIAVPEAMNEPIIASLAMAGTMIHELAHYNDRTEDRRELQRVLYVLEAAPDWLYREWQQRLVDVVARNWDIQTYLHGVMKNGLFNVRSRNTSLSTNPGSESTRGLAPDVGDVGTRAGQESGVPRGPATGTVDPAAVGGPAVGVGTDEGPHFVAGDNTPSAAATRREHQADLNRDGDPGVPAVPRQPEVDAILRNLGPAFASTGGVPPQVRTAGAHASRMNRFYKWMAGLDQLVKANPFFTPLLRYTERIRQMHNEESRVHDAALRISKRWRGLGAEGDRLASFLEDIALMSYRSPQEVAAGVKRMPTPAEATALVAKHKLSAEGVKVGDQIRRMFDGFLGILEANAIQSAQQTLQNNPVELANKINEIRAQTLDLRSKPYFPFLRFGRHFVMVKDAAGRVIHFETFERSGFRSAERQQQAAFKAEKARRPSTQVVTFGELAESSTPFIGMPPTLLNQLKLPRAQGGLGLTPQQITDLELIQLSYAPALSFRKRMFKSDQTPGYSHDFRRSFARYFFHGGRYYARTKYGRDLRGDIASARAVENSNKASEIGNYMEDHLDNTILDAKGDFGIFKAGIFLWAMGYVPAAAAQNMSQTPLVTFPYLSAKFGVAGVGEARATKAITKAMLNVRNFYKRGAYDRSGPLGQQFEYEALGYGIKTGRVSETQAPELAALSSGDNLIKGLAGNAISRNWTRVMDGSAKLFEFAEQFNRRVAFRAALDLATQHPTSKAVKEAINFYGQEYTELQAGSANQRPYTAAEAAAIVTACYVVDQTQFIYARYARPRFMRGRVAGTIFVFKKYMQSMLFLLGQNKSDVLPRYLLMMMLLGGAGGVPGYDDLKEILRALFYWRYGKDFNLDREVRQMVLSLFDGTVPPDLILHGLSRSGFGLPALTDMIGSYFTGTPGRGLDTSQHSASNVPFPVLDRSKAISMGHILPIEVGKMFGPTGDTNKVIAEQTQQASGAVFSVAFNMYKAIMDKDLEATDMKRYERAVPRLLSSASRAYRAYSEGRERGKGGSDSAPTIVPFDPRDTEQMMEILAMAGGYQPLRLQSKWDLILAQAEVTKFYDLKRQGLLGQMWEASQGKDPKEISDVRDAIVEYNKELPEWARGKVITPDTISRSLMAKARDRASREAGIPLQKTNIGIAREMQRLHPEAIVDVRRVR